MSYYYDNYEIKYPDIVIEILEYFNIQNKITDAGNKSISKFCDQFMQEGKYTYQPTIVSRICKRLCACGQMNCIKEFGALGINDNYLFLPNNPEQMNKQREWLKYYFNSMVYGFEYIYTMYKELVVPIVWERENGDYSAGTGFKYKNGIVTAKHCITDVKNLQIKGYKASDLEGKSVYISDNEGVDVAFIETDRLANPFIYSEEGEVMQEVLVMGYPKVPAFTNFLTAEIATISSKASSRITPTRGSIAAYGYEYLAKIEAMLITARIRGGNSGGPVINQNGCLVGVACQIPDCDKANGDYDDLGYGIAVPVKYVDEIIKSKSKVLDVPKDYYRDWTE